MSNSLADRIAQCRRRLAEISRQIDTLSDQKRAVEAELRACEDELAHELADGRSQVASMEHTLNDIIRDLSRIPPMWRSALFSIAARYPEPASLEDVGSVVRRTDPGIADGAIRSQLSIYTFRGLVSRIGPSMYQASLELHQIVSRYSISDHR
jgi:hypothetical protein